MTPMIAEHDGRRKHNSRSTRRSDRLRRSKQFQLDARACFSESDQETSERTEQMERLAVVGRSFTGLAHESRNALQRGQANLELLSLELQQQPELLKLAIRAQQALAEVHHLFGEVRDFSAPLHLEIQESDLADQWSQVWNELEISHPDKLIQFNESVRSADTLCDIDEFAMRQVFRNIFENAISACPNPGQIDVNCRDTELNLQPAIEISVRDNGPGLSTEQIDKIFDPFFTSKRAGTGLGMAIAKGIVAAHGGCVTARNAFDSGAEIVLCIPRTTHAVSVDF